MTAEPDAVRENVKARYAEAARAVSAGEGEGCGSGSCCATLEVGSAKFGEALYDAEQRAGLPAAAATASLGCGNPTAVAELREGETVLDLGSGGGIDVLLSARRVGPTGRRLRPRHDRGDARARPAQQGRGGSDERPLPARRDRERPAPGRKRRRRDLELRHQPLDGQGAGAARDRPRAPARRPGRRQRRRRRGPALTRRAGRARRLGGLHRRRALGLRVRRGPRGRRAHGRRGRRSRTRSPTACTERSCGRASRSRRGGSCHSSAPGYPMRAVRPPAAASGR